MRLCRSLRSLAVALPFEYRDNQGRLHCDDGPAVQYCDGTKAWLVHGDRHRVHGPAVEWADGTVEYWLDGEQVTRDQHATRTASP